MKIYLFNDILHFIQHNPSYIILQLGLMAGQAGIIYLCPRPYSGCSRPFSYYEYYLSLCQYIDLP